MKILSSPCCAIAVAGLALASWSGAQKPASPPDLFAGTAQFRSKATGVTELDLAGPALQARLANTAVAPWAAKVTFVSLRAYDFAAIAQFEPEDVEPYRARLAADGTWNCFIRTSFRSVFNDLCERTRSADHVTELALIDTTPSRLLFIHAAGSLSLAQLQRVSDVMLHPAGANR